MFRWTIRGWTLALVMLAGAGARAPAQGPPARGPDEGRPRRGLTSLINIDVLLENHARFLARRYNLTPEQEAFTQQFLQQKAHEFLDAHRDELFELADRMFEVRAGAEMDAEELIAWGKRALPLYEQAKHLIVEGNSQWREILTEEQRAVHDEDLRQMYESFSTTEEQLQRILTGQMTVDEFRRGPRMRRPARPERPQAVQEVAAAPADDKPLSDEPPAVVQRPEPPPPAVPPAAPPRVVREPPAPPAGPREGAVRPPVRPGPGDRSQLRRPVPGAAPAGQDFESEWERYVRDFIQRYQLDAGQTQRAEAILKDCQEQARNYMARRKAELERLDQQLKDLAGAADKAKALSEVSEQRKKLLEPITRIFEKRLKPRLETLPTRAQREAAEAAGRRPMDGGRASRPLPPRPEGVSQPGPARVPGRPPVEPVPQPEEPPAEPEQDPKDMPDEPPPE